MFAAVNKYNYNWVSPIFVKLFLWSMKKRFLKNTLESNSTFKIHAFDTVENGCFSNKNIVFMVCRVWVRQEINVCVDQNIFGVFGEFFLNYRFWYRLLRLQCSVHNQYYMFPRHHRSTLGKFEYWNFFNCLEPLRTFLLLSLCTSSVNLMDLMNFGLVSWRF